MSDHLHRRFLSIIRHGTAPSGFGTMADFERTLSPEGISESINCGIWLKKSLPQFPELILCSAATRTQQTLEEVKKKLA